MKKFLKILLFFVFLNQFALCRELNFIHISDVSLNQENAPYLKRTIKEINSLKNIDFVVFGGNNLQNPSFDNLEIFLYLLKRLHKKTYVLLGSSDVSSSAGINKEYYLKRVNKVKRFHPKNPYYTFCKKGYLFIVMDGSKQYFRSSNGYYSKDELLFLDKTLEKNKNKSVVILQHFPLLETSSKWMETSKTENYLEILKKYNNVKLIVSGHYGENIEVEKDGIQHFVTEAYSKNHAYKIIKLDLEDDFTGSYLIK